MRIQLVSDIHLECQTPSDRLRTITNILRGRQAADTLAIAGDFCLAAGMYGVLARLSHYYDHILYTPGNHEFYNSTLQEVSLEQEVLAQELPNVHTVQGDQVKRVVLDGQGIVLCTLWSPVPAKGQGQTINDCTHIQDYYDWVPGVFDSNRKALSSLLERGDVLLVHHLPSPHSVHPRYQRSPHNVYFLGDIEDIIKDKKPSAVLHGHTHTACSYTIGDTTVHCNPMGYPGENPSDYNYSYIVETS